MLLVQINFETRLSNEKRCQTFAMEASRQFSVNSPSKVILTLGQVKIKILNICARGITE